MTKHNDTHARPPTGMRDVYKRYHKLRAADLDDCLDLICFDGSGKSSSELARETNVTTLPAELRVIYNEFLAEGAFGIPKRYLDDVDSDEAKVYEVPDLPGLFIYPNLLPPSVQLSLLDRLLHRDLSKSEHQTNVHMHHHMTYPSREQGNTVSFFHESANNLHWLPRDPTAHKALDTKQFLDKKLRWVTLGGQYDWTNKIYPEGRPPAFPSDVKDLIEDMFPMKAEAAIVNLYSPGDTLSLHRDVSEECNRPLVSISLGCDAVFICGLHARKQGSEPRVAAIRLQSGDAVLMSGESRYAWHGVPKVLADTCPEWMQDWPSGIEADIGYEHWKGWMKGKRINVNIRQMFA